MAGLKIIKVGGNIIDNPEALNHFLVAFSKVKGPKILVHGGGKLATKLAKDMQVPVNMIDGRRITDAETLDIITMVYAGKINKSIVAQLQGLQCNALGFTGADGNTIQSVKRPVKTIDYGFVGDIENVHPEVLEPLLKLQITPVFCAITHDKKGQLLNTNADTIASALAVGLSELFDVELIYIFEKNGVLLSVEDDDSVIENMNTEIYEKLKQDGIIADGMLPKLTNCFEALKAGVSKVVIGNASVIGHNPQKHTTLKL